VQIDYTKTRSRSFRLFSYSSSSSPLPFLFLFLFCVLCVFCGYKVGDIRVIPVKAIG
jgi:hypothetical protein